MSLLTEQEKVANIHLKKGENVINHTPSTCPTAFVMIHPNGKTYVYTNSNPDLEEPAAELIQFIETHSNYGRIRQDMQIDNNAIIVNHLRNLVFEGPLDKLGYRGLKPKVTLIMQKVAQSNGYKESNPGYTNPRRRPSWWPQNIGWRDLKSGFTKECFKQIIHACFLYYGVDLVVPESDGER